MKIDLVLEENNTTSFQKAMEAEADKSLKHFEKELLKVRTGRAHTSLVEDILVLYHELVVYLLAHLLFLLSSY